MPKNLVFLCCGQARRKDSFLQHIYLPEPIHIPIDGKTTFGDLFDALQSKFEDKPEDLEAANGWIALQTHDVSEEEAQLLLKHELLDVEPDEGIEFYAIFDLVPER